MTLISVVQSSKPAYCGRALLLRSSAPPGKASYLKIAPGHETLWLECGFFVSRKEILPLQPQHCPFLWGFFLSIFQFSLRGNCSKRSCDFVMSMGGSEFRVPLCRHLPSLNPSVLNLLMKQEFVYAWCLHFLTHPHSLNSWHMTLI